MSQMAKDSLSNDESKNWQMSLMANLIQDQSHQELRNI